MEASFIFAVHWKENVISIMKITDSYIWNQVFALFIVLRQT